MQDEIEPLPRELWYARIEAIKLQEFGEIESRLRHAFHLLQLTPRALRFTGYWQMDEAYYEALLESRDFDAAAQALTAARSLSVSSRFEGGRVQVVVRCNEQGSEALGEGETVAEATLQALANCLLGQTGADLGRLTAIQPRAVDRIKLTQVNPI